MKLKRFEEQFSVCKVKDYSQVSLADKFLFIGKTDEELSLVCLTKSVPENTITRDDGWKAIRIQGELDFSLIGILSKISSVLADNNIGIFAISTYNTDYILIKDNNYEKALTVLGNAGYKIV
ncbi:MAG: ACT domain-containing protein [Clostridiaceae bacterium]